MDSAKLARIGESLRNVAAAFAERHRQETTGGRPPFTHVGECLATEAIALAAEDQTALASALLALRSEAEGTGNE